MLAINRSLRPEEHATLVAALHFYVQRGMADKAYRSDELQALATDYGRVIPLDEEGAFRLLDLLRGQLS